MSGSGATLLSYWRSQSGLGLMPPATAEQINAFERHHRVKLPDDVRDYYRAANGFAPPGDQDENGFSFWPLARVSPLNAFDDGKWAASQAADWFIFADYLSLSWAYAFRLSAEAGPAPVSIVGTATGTPRLIADNFLLFADLYVRDDARLYSANDSAPQE